MLTFKRLTSTALSRYPIGGICHSDKGRYNHAAHNGHGNPWLLEHIDDVIGNVMQE